MTRVSLTEDYDDRSVIAKLKKLTDAVNTASAESKEATEKASNAVQLTGETSQVIDGEVTVDSLNAGTNSEIAGAAFEESGGKTVISNENGITINGVTPTNVVVAETGSASQLAKYITVDGTEWKLGGEGGDGKVKDVTVDSVSVLDEDTGIANVDLSGYAKKSEISQVMKFKGSCTNAQLANKTGMAVGDVWNITDSTVFPAGSNVAWDGSSWDKLSETVDLSLYAKKTDLPTKTSQLTNDSGYLTAVPDTYATKTQAQGYASTAESNAKTYTDTAVTAKATVTIRDWSD